MVRHCDGFTCCTVEQKLEEFGGKYYRNGSKFCKVCHKFMKIDGYRCPCCRSSVRTKSHCKKWRNGMFSLLLTLNGQIP